MMYVMDAQKLNDGGQQNVNGGTYQVIISFKIGII
jgi:hypothetical protein